jgi:hypothetical protein
MSTLVFDTHKAFKTLQEAGANERLAEAVVATVGDAMGENVATKADLAALRSDLQSDIAALEARLYRHLWIMAIGIVSLTVALVKVLS